MDSRRARNYSTALVVFALASYAGVLPWLICDIPSNMCASSPSAHSLPLGYKRTRLAPNVLFLLKGALLLLALAPLLLYTKVLYIDVSEGCKTHREVERTIDIEHCGMNSASGGSASCATCRAPKPLRSLHCDVCGCCVALSSGHSRLFGRCIGMANRAYVWSFFIALYMYSCAVAVLCSVHLWQHLYYDCPSNLTTRSTILIFCLVYVLSRFAYRGIKTIALEAALNRTRHEMQRPKHPEHWYMWISSSSRPGHHENPFNVRDPLKNLRLYFDKTLWCAGHETPSWDTLRRWRSDKLALYPQRTSPVFALIFTFLFLSPVQLLSIAPSGLLPVQRASSACTGYL